jgi:hypothetical protein
LFCCGVPDCCPPPLFFEMVGASETHREPPKNAYSVKIAEVWTLSSVG